MVCKTMMIFMPMLLWAREGWIDYNIPQIYWRIGHPVADYETLVKWWAKEYGKSSFVHRSVGNEYGAEC